MSEVHVMDHPLIQHKISYIRREDVGTKEFREVISEIASLMCYEATRDLKLQDVTIKTPICEMVGKELTGKKAGSCTDLKSGTWYGRWNVIIDSGRKSRSHRSVP